jgi:hypothetical protein
MKPFPNPVVSGFVVRQACPELAEVAHHEREMMLTMGEYTPPVRPELVEGRN